MQIEVCYQVLKREKKFKSVDFEVRNGGAMYLMRAQCLPDWLFCKCIGLFGSIASLSAVTFKFSTNGRFINADYFGNHRLCKTYFKHRIYYVSLFWRELAVVFHLCASYLTVRKVRSLQRLRFFHNQSLSCTNETLQPAHAGKKIRNIFVA